MRKNVYIAWTRYMRRPESLQRLLDFEVTFIEPISENRALKFLGYFISVFSTLKVACERRPETLWLQLAPSILLYPAFLYKWLFCRDVLIVADCHNGLLRARWLNLPFVKRLLSKCDLVLFHNSMVLARARILGITGDHVRLLHTPPAVPSLRVAEPPALAVNLGAPFALVPGSFRSDEPVSVVLDAASRLPHLMFVLTGDRTVAARNHDLRDLPSNVILTGFVPTAALDWLLAHAAVVIALTKHLDVELSAGNEALGFGRPLVVTDSEVSRDLFSDYSVMVDPQSVDSLTAGIEQALEGKASIQERSEELKKRRFALSRRETEAIMKQLSYRPIQSDGK